MCTGTDRPMNLQFFAPQFRSRPTAKPGPMSQRLAATYTGAAVAPPHVVLFPIQRCCLARICARFDIEMLGEEGQR